MRDNIKEEVEKMYDEYKEKALKELEYILDEEKFNIVHETVSKLNFECSKVDYGTELKFRYDYDEQKRQELI